MRYIKFGAALAGLALLTACNTDPLSTKPETNAQLPPATDTPASEEDADPEDPAPEPVPAPEPDPITAPAPITEPAPEPAPVIQPDPVPTPTETIEPIPRTDKLVRGLISGSTMTLKPGQTLTVAMNANRSEGYAWQMDTLPDGLELAGEYYREGESPFPDRASIGGARYFLITANAAGTYRVRILHIRPGDADPRVTKSFTLDVAE